MCAQCPAEATTLDGMLLHLGLTFTSFALVPQKPSQMVLGISHGNCSFCLPSFAEGEGVT